MKAKTPNYILPIIIFLLYATVSKAQEKYDLMNITYDTQRGGIYFSINGTQFTKEEVDLPKTSNTAVNTNPLLKRVNEFQEKNWELISLNSYPIGGAGINGVHYSHVAYLKKKRTEPGK